MKLEKTFSQLTFGNVKRSGGFLFQMVLCLASFFLVVAPVTAESRNALVIGNAAYRDLPALSNPVNDAQLVAESLHSLGFEVTLLLDSDLRTMRDEVRTLSTVLSSREDAVGFFYYAGHGVQAGGENYLIPIGADIRTENDLRYEALPVNYVLDYINETGSTFSMVVLDACRDNPFATFRSGSRGLSIVEAPRGSIVMYSTGAGDVAEDGTGVNSTFTSAFVANMGADGIDVTEFARRVMRDVSFNTNGRQLPAFYSNYFGQFRFSDSGVEPTPDQPRVIENTAPVQAAPSESQTVAAVRPSVYPRARVTRSAWTGTSIDLGDYRYWFQGTRGFMSFTDDIADQFPDDLQLQTFVDEYEVNTKRGVKQMWWGVATAMTGGSIAGVGGSKGSVGIGVVGGAMVIGGLILEAVGVTGWNRLPDDVIRYYNRTYATGF